MFIKSSHPKVKAIGLAVGTGIVATEIHPSSAAAAAATKLGIVRLGETDAVISPLAVVTAATDHHDRPIAGTPVSKETDRVGGADVAIAGGMLKAVSAVVVVGEGHVAGAPDRVARPRTSTIVAELSLIHI